MFPSSTIPLVGGIPNSYVSISTDLLKGSSFMGFFPLLPPKVPLTIFMVSTIPHDPTNPWIFLTTSYIDAYGKKMSLSPAELAYQAIESALDSPVTLVMTNVTVSSTTTSPSNDILNQVLPSNEAIREIMCL